jgi:hypothetical protein
MLDAHGGCRLARARLDDGFGVAMKVTFDEDAAPIECATLAELDSVLDAVHAAASSPILVCVDLPEHRLDIGLGMDPSFLIVNTQPCDGEYWVALGDGPAGDELDVFGCGVHQTVNSQYLIPLSDTRRALRAFVETGIRSPLLSWEDWSGRRV